MLAQENESTTTLFDDSNAQRDSRENNNEPRNGREASASLSSLLVDTTDGESELPLVFEHDDEGQDDDTVITSFLSPAGVKQMEVVDATETTERDDDDDHYFGVAMEDGDKQEE